MTWPAWLVLMAAVLRVNGIDWSFDPPEAGVSPKRSTAGSTPEITMRLGIGTTAVTAGLQYTPL